MATFCSESSNRKQPIQINSISGFCSICSLQAQMLYKAILFSPQGISLGNPPPAMTVTSLWKKIKRAYMQSALLLWALLLALAELSFPEWTLFTICQYFHLIDASYVLPISPIKWKLNVCSNPKSPYIAQHGEGEIYQPPGQNGVRSENMFHI